ncbi:MAG TPA: polymer-forming cytoskeletal protein [Casimicrobiaceae bacterium]|nr:polymer-forming cytoskeletal protein [Casimicrobiaceae bacterium]
MFNFNRGDAKTPDKHAAKPSPYPYAPVPSVPTLSNAVPAKPQAPASANPRNPAPIGAAPVEVTPQSAPRESAPRAIGPDTRGSQLIVGPNIKLRGVEISDCDVLVVEGQVEATVNSKAMQIAKPGTLKGIAVIDVAEIEGEFSGELTAHDTLIVRGTGRVSGKIRYGRLIVAEGGEMSGDVQRIVLDDRVAPKPETAVPGARVQLSPQP